MRCCYSLTTTAQNTETFGPAELPPLPQVPIFDIPMRSGAGRSINALREHAQGGEPSDEPANNWVELTPFSLTDFNTDVVVFDPRARPTPDNSYLWVAEEVPLTASSQTGINFQDKRWRAYCILCRRPIKREEAPTVEKFNFKGLLR